MVLTLSLIGCDDNEISSRGGGGGLLGTWTGNSFSTVESFQRITIITIVSDDWANLLGTAVIHESSCFESAGFSGTRSGNTVNANLSNGPNVMNVLLALGGDTLSGNYIVASGACAGDRGTIRLHR